MNEPTSQQNQAAEPRRDEREAFEIFARQDGHANFERCSEDTEAYEDASLDAAWSAWASRASAALPQSANEILQTLKFAKEVIDDQVARFHEGCRCQLCESLPESLQRAIELLESSKKSAPQTAMLEFISDYVATWKDAHPVKDCARPSVCLVCRGRKLLGEAEYQRIHSAVPQPSASAAPLSQNVRKLWIVEWKFTGVGGDWKSIHSEPFETEAAALTYPKRQGFEYRVVEYSASQPQPSAGQTEGESNG